MDFLQNSVRINVMKGARDAIDVWQINGAK